MEEIDEQVEDEELDEEVDQAEATGEEGPAPAPPRAGDEDVESIQDILVKQEARSSEGAEEDDESVLTLSREERLEPLAVKVIPPQQHEFICKNCFLVKHRSQLKDKTRMLCRDCA